MSEINNRYISCVEYYILNWLNGKIDVRKVYFQSYISLETLYGDYQKQNIRFCDYDKIKRIQDILLDYKYINCFVSDNIDYENLLEEDLNLILVNESFYSSEKIKPLRNDHYLQINIRKNKVAYTNSYPIQQAETSMYSLSKWFDGKRLTYIITNEDRLTYKDVLNLFKEELYNHNFNTINDLLNVANIVSLSLILKVSRYRLYDFLCYLNEQEALKDIDLIPMVLEAAEYYENIFLKMNMLALKKGQDIVTIANTIYKINYYEEKIHIKLRKEFL